jgi:hypothetical protein
LIWNKPLSPVEKKNGKFWAGFIPVKLYSLHSLYTLACTGLLLNIRQPFPNKIPENFPMAEKSPRLNRFNITFRLLGSDTTSNLPPSVLDTKILTWLPPV